MVYTSQDETLIGGLGKKNKVEKKMTETTNVTSKDWMNWSHMRTHESEIIRLLVTIYFTQTYMVRGIFSLTFSWAKEGLISCLRSFRIFPRSMRPGKVRRGTTGWYSWRIIMNKRIYDVKCLHGCKRGSVILGDCKEGTRKIAITKYEHH